MNGILVLRQCAQMASMGLLSSAVITEEPQCLSSWETQSPFEALLEMALRCFVLRAMCGEDARDAESVQC